MTGRTHDLAAFTALNLILITGPLPHLTLSTALVALAANMLGGVAPDADQPTGDLWKKLPAGSILAKIFRPFIGTHRHLSHSFVGLILVGLLLRFILDKSQAVLLVDMNLVWWSFMIGYFSHLLVDSLTTDGVPWLLPIPWRIGFPPLSFLRIRTGGFRERVLFFPTLLLINGLLFYFNYSQYLVFVKSFLVK